MESATKPESESMIQIILQEREGGEREVETPAGAINLLTDEEVIEIKHVHNWKDATKVLVYQTYFSDRKPRVHLFGGYSKQTRSTIEEAFSKLNITITWERPPF
jgi:DNA polymerase III delta subunit